MADSNAVRPEDIGSLVCGTEDRVKSFLSNQDLSVRDLETLLEAEQAGKDRQHVKNLLYQRLADTTLEEATVAETRTIIADAYDRDEDNIALPSAEDTDDEFISLNKAVTGTVSQLKSFINEHDLNPDQLSYLLGLEVSGANRKIAVGIIRRNLEEARKQRNKHQKKREQLIEALQKNGFPEHRLKGADVADLQHMLENMHARDQATAPTVVDADRERRRKKRFLQNNGISEERLENVSADDLDALVNAIRQQQESERQRLMADLEDHGLSSDKIESAKLDDLRELHDEVVNKDDDGMYFFRKRTEL